MACFAYGETALVERHVEGVEVAVSVVDGPATARARCRPSRSCPTAASTTTPRATPPAPPSSSPRPGSPPRSPQACAALALSAHAAYGLRDLSRTDLIVDAEGRPWFLEVNVSPGMTETSLFPQAVHAAGEDLGALLAGLVHQASARGRRGLSRASCRAVSSRSRAVGVDDLDDAAQVVHRGELDDHLALGAAHVHPHPGLQPLRQPVGELEQAGRRGAICGLPPLLGCRFVPPEGDDLLHRAHREPLGDDPVGQPLHRLGGVGGVVPRRPGRAGPARGRPTAPRPRPAAAPRAAAAAGAACWRSAAGTGRSAARAPRGCSRSRRAAAGRPRPPPAG